MQRRILTVGATRAVALLGALALVDALTPHLILAGYFGLPVLIAAVTCGPRPVAGIGAVAEVTTIVSGVWDDRFGTTQHVAACLLTAAQAAVAVAVSVARRRREAELGLVQAVADVAQHALLPTVPGQLAGVGFAARYLSATQEALIGGDLYEVVAAGQTVRVIVGDVKGKGLPAVRLTTVVLGAFREAAVTWLELEQVAAACGRAVSREADAEDFVTALMIDIHADGTLRLLSAGHPPPALLSGGTGRMLPVGVPSPPLGIAESYAATTARWEPGDRLLLFTDGLIEARDHRGQFFPLEDHLDDLAAGSLDSSLRQLTDRLHAHVGGNLHDDLALLVAERLGAPATPAPRTGTASDDEQSVPTGPSPSPSPSRETAAPATAR